MKDLSLLEIDKYLRSFVNVEADLKRIDGFTVYRVKDLVNKSADESIFAIIKNNSKPVLLHLACEKHLAKLLRTKYETISPSKINNQFYQSDKSRHGQNKQEKPSQAYLLLLLSHE